MIVPARHIVLRGVRYRMLRGYGQDTIQSEQRAELFR